MFVVDDDEGEDADEDGHSPVACPGPAIASSSPAPPPVSSSSPPSPSSSPSLVSS